MRDCRCEACGKAGDPHGDAIVPEGWSFYTVRDDSESEYVTLIYACSEACKVLPWRAGPGSLDAEDLVQPASEPRFAPGIGGLS